MDPNRFDQLTRRLATGVSRRQVLQGLFGFVVGSLLNQIGFRTANAYAEARPSQAQGIFLPLLARVCTEASRGTDRHYCGEYDDCICIQAAEGDLRCGKIPSTCDMPLCTTSDDCAHLGPGYFCDTPYSGNCTEPPAELARCIPPCTADCPPAQRCGVGCCAEGDICVDGQCATVDDCDFQAVTLESMREALVALASGATDANVSPQGCIQAHQTFANGELTTRSLTIGGKTVSNWLRTNKQWTGYRDSDLDGFYEWRATTVEGDTADDYHTVELEYSPETQQVVRRTTITPQTDVVHIVVEDRDAHGVYTVVADYETPRVQEATLADALIAQTDATPALTCEANPCDPAAIKQRMEEGVNLALQCLSNFGDRGVAIYEAAFNTLARNMTVRCATIAGETQAHIGGWDHPQGSLTVTVDPTKYCGLDDGQRAWLLFHEVLHAALRRGHDPSIESMPLAQRNQLDRVYGCIALCYTNQSSATACMCAQCLGTVTCDPICAAFSQDCGATCPCPARSGEYYTTCGECLVGCPAGLSCFGYSYCDPVGNSPVCPPVTCP